MKTYFCLPIIKNKKIDVLKIIQENEQNYSYFEIWLDYINNVDLAFVKKLTKILKGRVIFVLRRKNLQKTHMTFKLRTDFILSLANSQSLLDLDIGTQVEELNYIQSHFLKIKTIISYHNYIETPNATAFEKIIAAMNKYQPKVFKISTMCNNQQDALQLLQLLLRLRSRDMKFIVLGMGNAGVITRVFGTLWGNELIYAPTMPSEISAKGQLTRNQLQTIFRELKK